MTKGSGREAAPFLISMKNMRILLLQEINICQNNNFPKESTFFIDSLPEIRYIIDDYAVVKTP